VQGSKTQHSYFKTSGTILFTGQTGVEQVLTLIKNTHNIGNTTSKILRVHMQEYTRNRCYRIGFWNMHTQAETRERFHGVEPK
jgi:hypothetical protein